MDGNDRGPRTRPGRGEAGRREASFLGTFAPAIALAVGLTAVIVLVMTEIGARHPGGATTSASPQSPALGAAPSGFEASPAAGPRAEGSSAVPVEPPLWLFVAFVALAAFASLVLGHGLSASTRRAIDRADPPLR